MMNMMTSFKQPTSVQTTSIERIGGDFTLESGVYPFTVDMVYMHQSSTNAVGFNVTLITADKKTLKETFYIKSGDTKGNKTYYTKDNINYPLPGYAVADSMCIALLGLPLHESLATEKKVVKVYNFDEKKEVPTEVPVVIGLLGKSGTVAVHKIKENKRSKNAAGQWVPTDKVRTFNECKFFGNAEGKTAEEIKADSPAAVLTEWAEVHTGVTVDKTNSTKSTPPSVANTGSTTVSDLFK